VRSIAARGVSLDDSNGCSNDSPIVGNDLILVEQFGECNGLQSSRSSILAFIMEDEGLSLVPG